MSAAQEGTVLILEYAKRNTNIEKKTVRSKKLKNHVELAYWDIATYFNFKEGEVLVFR